MPELPEIETVVRQLAPLLRRRRIERLEILDPLLGELPSSKLHGRCIERVLRLGKQVVLALVPGNGRGRPTAYLAIHLRMTGRLVWCGSMDGIERRHLRAILLLHGGATVLFYDVRRFGTLTLHRSLDEARPAGIDPLDRSFTPATLRRLLGRGPQAIKPWLLRQDRLVGLGNIYASEILFEAAIDPRREVGSLTDIEIRRLHRSTRQVLERAVRHCGTTFSDFQDARGLTGSYQRFLKVYRRAEEPCSVCGDVLVRVVQQQRSTFFCPGCQK